VTRTWTAKWYHDKEYTALLTEDIAVRALVEKRLANASVSGLEIERNFGQVTVTVHTAKPGIVIGKGGQNVEILRQQIGALTKRKVKLESRRPPAGAGRYRRHQHQPAAGPPHRLQAMKQSIQRSMKAGAKGVKVAGRLGSAEMTAAVGPRGRIRSARSAPTSATARCTRTTCGPSASRSKIHRGDVTPRAPPRDAVPAAAPVGSLTDAAAEASQTAACAAGCPANRAATTSPSLTTAPDRTGLDHQPADRRRPAP
jgi:small subunit ribosomal protein S3